MRKAFDTNVPRLRPRLKSASVGEVHPDGDGLLPAVGGTSEAAMESERGDRLEAPAIAALPAVEPGHPASEDEPSPAVEPTVDAATLLESAVIEPPPCAPAASPPEPPPARATELDATVIEPGGGFTFVESSDVQSRRERLLKIKRKVTAAARRAPPMPALPETPARAGESALSLVRDLEVQLQRSRELESALRADLDQARAELARGAAEARRGAERLAAVEAQVEEKRSVLEEMLAEMSALEEERDGAVGRAQALTALDEERQTLLDGLSTRAEEAEKKRVEAEAEVARLGAELQERAADSARVRAALAEVTRERDDLARELAEARRERDELSEARKALEQVHEALATARTRLA